MLKFIIIALVVYFIWKHRPVLYTTPNVETWKLFTDALSQPHLLIAGATGSGKSVIENGLVSTILTRLPLDCCNEGQRPGAQMILIDPKGNELNMYADMPHTLKYAYQPEDMISALNYAMQITEKRFAEMRRKGQRKYNGGDVYVIIDEFADLMTTKGKTVKPVIQRLCQLGRAARVHVIICTQTPIAKVLPTEIKCNFDARFGLRTRSAQDSRNIIGQSGLELLPKYGQGYYMTPDVEGYWNIPYVQDEEIDRLIAYWKSAASHRKAA